MTDAHEPPKLRRQQQVFVNEYLRCWNGAEAARRAGYKSKSNVKGSQLLANVSIAAAIQARLAEVHMSADEALKLTADIARGDIAEMMDISSVGFNLDLQTAKERGLTKLIKRVKQRTTTFISKKPDDEDREIVETEIELYDAQTALRDVLKIAGRYVDRTDITSGGKPLKGYTIVSPEDWKQPEDDE